MDKVTIDGKEYELAASFGSGYDPRTGAWRESNIPLGRITFEITQDHRTHAADVRSVLDVHLQLIAELEVVAEVKEESAGPGAESISVPVKTAKLMA
ncbi:MAG: hypothetical protein ACOC2P_01225 [Spirochaetota bacterium]